MSNDNSFVKKYRLLRDISFPDNLSKAGTESIYWDGYYCFPYVGKKVVDNGWLGNAYLCMNPQDYPDFFEEVVAPPPVKEKILVKLEGSGRKGETLRVIPYNHNHLIPTYKFLAIKSAIEFVLNSDDGKAFWDKLEAALNEDTVVGSELLVAANEEILNLKKELEVTEKLLEERQSLLDNIPECPAHGKCVPHALAWIGKMKSKTDTVVEDNGGIPLPKDFISTDNIAMIDSEGNKKPLTDLYFLKYTQSEVDAMMENVWNAAREIRSSFTKPCYTHHFENNKHRFLNVVKFQSFKDYQDSLPENKPPQPT